MIRDADSACGIAADGTRVDEKAVLPQTTSSELSEKLGVTVKTEDAPPAEDLRPEKDRVTT